MSRKVDIEEAFETIGMAYDEVDRLEKQPGDFLFVSTWGNGDEISMGTRKDVKDTLEDKLSRTSDEAYDIQIVNIKTGNEVTWNFKVTASIT